MEPILHLSLPVRNLAEARDFYVHVLDCRPGRVGVDWLDVWFFGLQLTLQERPDEVLPHDAQGVRHFGVTLAPGQLERLLARLQEVAVPWVAPPATDPTGALSGKTGAKIADPSGNVIELKAYDDAASALGAT